MIYVNRELSWLSFDERVLDCAFRGDIPLCERMKFAAIYDNNLDEFFMIRVGTLTDQAALPEPERDFLGLSPEEQLSRIFSRVRDAAPSLEAAFSAITEELSDCGVTRVTIDPSAAQEYAYLRDYFVRNVLPLTSPQIIDGRHPFPFLKNLGLYAAVRLLPQKDKEVKPVYGLIPVGAPLDRLITLPGGNGMRYLLLEDLIREFAGLAFRKYRAVETAVFRVTRNADIEPGDLPFDMDMDFRDAMTELMKQRRRLTPVRLQLSEGASPELTRFLQKKLELTKNQVFARSCPLDLTYLFSLYSRVREKGQRSSLFYPPVTDVNISDILSTKEIYSYLRSHDLLLYYPFNSFKTMISLLQDAADDPDTVSVKVTLYRLAPGSRVISALIKAAENGKDVTAVVELRARFDEENNINWSKQLTDAGVTVIYGSPGLKVHSKLLLITRRRGTEIEYLTQVGTGNYNEDTARLYTDFSLLTLNRDIGSEASMVMGDLAVGELTEHSHHLLVAPHCLKNRIIELIDREIAMALAGEAASIVIKCNSLSDREIMDKFVEASCAGVKIELYVRGICCLIPGVPGYTENITVKSIVGRLLEHSRLYVFGVGERQRMFISSADFMTRNTRNRVEVACPIYDPSVRALLLCVVEALSADATFSRTMTPEGTYLPPTMESGRNAQEEMFALMREDAQKYAAWKKTVKKDGKTSFFSRFLGRKR